MALSAARLYLHQTTVTDADYGLNNVPSFAFANLQIGYCTATKLFSLRMSGVVDF